jgi:iron(III) transport system ATP-binding protein
MGASAIRIERVDLAYGAVQVLKGIDLEIRAGEFFAFLGPSGCGKTTLLRLIAGFASAQRGRVLVGDTDISGLPPWKRDVGMVFQNYALWPHLSIRRNVAFGLEERRLPRAEIARRVDAILELVGLSALAERRPSELSGGQQQRVALARTVVVEPKVLLLDEPLSNLDAKLRVQMRRELLAFQRKLGLTSIFVTHDQEEANTICDRIAVMNDGRVLQVGAPMELYDRPANLFVASFLGTANLLAGRALGEGASRRFAIDGGGDVAIPVGSTLPRKPTLVFRPQSVSLAPPGTPALPGCVRLSGRVAHQEFLGGAIRYAVRCGATEILADRQHQPGEPVIGSGSELVLDIAQDKLLFLEP